MRKILHVDMDAFFAAVEQRDDVRLRGRPVAVGGRTRRGVVASASYEARAFGVRSAMPTAEALRRCPDLVLVPARFEAYAEVSHHLRHIFDRYTLLVEPLSLDEAYLDVTEPLVGPPSATRLAQQIRRDIRAETGLTASAGGGAGKFIAKVASDYRKPDGLCIVPPGEALAFVAGLRIEQFHGVGPATAARMHRLGIFTGADLRACPLAVLEQHFGVRGQHLWKLARAIDTRPVRPHRRRKSVGAEKTYAFDLATHGDWCSGLHDLAHRVATRLAHYRLQGHTLTLKIKYRNFEIHTRAHSLRRPIGAVCDLYSLAVHLLGAAPVERPVRLLGLSVSGLCGEDVAWAQQMELFGQRHAPSLYTPSGYDVA